jgi:hypothetical protein
LGEVMVCDFKIGQNLCGYKYRIGKLHANLLTFLA